ncbi:MAG: glycosyltransferase family 4 protein [Alcaligenaceae bacterium]
MKSLVFAIPGDLSTATGGYIYDRHIIEGLRTNGWDVQVLGLGEGFPYPDIQTRQKACESLLALEAEVPLAIDGLAFGVLPEVAAQLRERHPLIALVHHPLAFETGLSAEQSAHFMDTERRALAHATRVVVTSPATLKDVVEYFAVPREAITSILPGTDRVSRISKPAAQGPLQLLSVGSVVKRKGFDVLLAALAGLLDLPWQLTIAGDLTRDAQAVAQLHLDLDRFDLLARVQVLGAVDSVQLQQLYAQADVFVLASRFEGYGMAYAEALAQGLPVIGTTAGAIPDTVPATAGLLAKPGDVDSLLQALRKIMQDQALRQSLAQGALLAAAQQPSWADAAALFKAVVERARADYAKL